MHTKEPREDPLTDMGYETRDINFKALGSVALIFVVFIFLCFGVVAVWVAWYGPQMASKFDPRKPMPSPELQSNITVRTDIATMRQNETNRLSTYGRNPDGSYWIPVEDAIDKITKSGLPHAQTAVPATSPGNTIPQNALPPGQHAPANTPIVGGP